MYHFSRIIVFSVWPLQMEVIMHRGRWFFTKKRKLNPTSLPKYFPKHPTLPLGPGIRGCITEAWCRPIPPPAGSEGGRVTSLRHPADWTHLELLLWGDALIAKYAVWPNPKHSPSADCCDYARCPCVCLWERQFQTALEEQSLHYWVLLWLLCFQRSCCAPFPRLSIISQSNQGVFLLLSSLDLVYFPSSQTPPVENWVHLTKTYE